MKITFTKMHGIGNDFILIDCRKKGLRNAGRLALRLCDRRFGIGADQMLLLYPSRKADCRMKIFNADGSEVEMCGNGIRCLAKFVWESPETPVSLRKSESLSVETLAGIIRPEKSGNLIRVDMGEPVTDPERVPVRAGRTVRAVINYQLKAGKWRGRVTAVSMGNPHAVTVVKDVTTAPVTQAGPLIEKHRMFPKKTNVEFIEVLSKKKIRARVWERGAGETLACGTGACASVVASSMLGLTGRNADVHLPGGVLNINWSEDDNHVYMTGPAERIFEGRIDI